VLFRSISHSSQSRFRLHIHKGHRMGQTAFRGLPTAHFKYIRVPSDQTGHVSTKRNKLKLQCPSSHFRSTQVTFSLSVPVRSRSNVHASDCFHKKKPADSSEPSCCSHETQISFPHVIVFTKRDLRALQSKVQIQSGTIIVSLYARYSPFL
jgi:hypothetical protein